ncbi:MAG: hypothetical protein ACREJ6_00960, partial [Candidatus Methylomirabilis sp.]
MSLCTFDFETRSYADLKKVGSWAYSQDPTTDPICAAWGIGTGEIQTWWPGKHSETNAIRSDLYVHIASGGIIEAHNVAFEKSIWKNVMMPRYGWPYVPDEQWRDTMAVAAYLALPLGLDHLAAVLGYQGKHADGGRLISKYCKLYLKTAKFEIPEEDFARIVAYCVQDVRIEQSVSDHLGDLPQRELPLFFLHQKMSERGLYLDREGIEAASAVVEKRSEDLTNEFRSITGLNPTQRDKCLDWFRSEGIELEDMTADSIEEALEEFWLPQGPPRRALEIRLAINKASTKKLDAMARQRSEDGRARFQTRYHGAVTGRETGTGFQ